MQQDLASEKKLAARLGIMGMGLAAVGAAVLVLSPYGLLGGALAAAGAALFMSNRMINKSLALTAPKQQALLQSTRQRLEDIRRQLSKCKFLEKIEAEGTKAAALAEQLLEQDAQLRRLLEQKFEPGEITHGRYLGAVDSAALGIGENLLRVKADLESLNATAAATPEWQQKRASAGQHLSEIEGGLKELTGLFDSLSKIITKETHRDQLEQSLEQVKLLAERAQKYSKSQT